MNTLRGAMGVILLAAEWLCAGSAATTTAPARSSIPYVATRNDAVRDMLWLADVGKDDIVYDLGSGDGRIVVAAVRDSGARRAVGVENDPNRIRQSRENAQKAGVTDRVQFVQGDLFAADFSQASVVALFLGHQANIDLRPKILGTLKPGARVLSHQFGMGEWPADKELTVRRVYFGMWGTQFNPYKQNSRVPDYSANEMRPDTSDKVLMWVVPAPAAGIWRGKVQTPDGPRDCRLTLHQRFEEVSGTFELSGETPLSVGIRGELWGDHLRFESGSADLPYGQFQVRFDGHTAGDSTKGTMAVTDRGRLCEHSWEARRDKTDLTGQWEWTCATGDRPVRLRVERRDGRLVGTYTDRDKETPVPDLYDFGGGFYFTLLIGRMGSSLVAITEDTGWLIGEGVLDQGELKGTIDFYPYSSRGMPPGPDGKRTPQPEVHRDWTPRPIKS